MSATLSTIIRPTVTETQGALSRLLSFRWNRIARSLNHRAAIKHLRAFEDHELSDIGLERSQIEAAVQGGVSAPWR